MENQVIKDQTLQGCHYVIMGFRALKLLSEGFGGVKPCNHQYRGCHLKNPTDINIYCVINELNSTFEVQNIGDEAFQNTSF